MSAASPFSGNERLTISSPFLTASARYRRWRVGDREAESRSRRALQWVLIAWLILAVAISVRTLLRPASHTVFPIFATAAQHWWSDQPLYQDDPILDNFRYPPVFTLFVTPFSACGLRVGGILWSWVSLTIYAAGLYWFVREVIPSSWSQPRLALFLMLAALGGLRGLWNAQSNALIVGLLLLGTAALARCLKNPKNEIRNPKEISKAKSRISKNGFSRFLFPLLGFFRFSDFGFRISREAGEAGWWFAALLLAAPVCLKLTPLAPVLLLVVLWPRQLVWRLVVVSAVFFLLPFLTRPPGIVLEHYREWFDHLLETGGSRWLGFRDGWTIWLVLRHLFEGGPGGIALREPIDSLWYLPLQLASAAAVLLWCLWQRRRAARLGLGSRWLIHVTLSMGLAWLMLFGPAVEHATYVFLAPPLVWGLLERRAWPLGQGIILASFVLIMILGWGAVSRLLSDWPVLLTALPAGTALFTLWLVGYAHSCGDRIGGLPHARWEVGTAISKRLAPCIEGEGETTIQS